MENDRIWEIENSALGWEKEPWFLEGVDLLEKISLWAQSVSLVSLEVRGGRGRERQIEFIFSFFFFPFFFFSLGNGSK